MKTNIKICFLLSLSLVIFNSCGQPTAPGTFGYDLDFLKKHKKTIVLTSDENCQIAIIPDYQGRIMTSTSKGMNGKSYGWLNYDLISSGKFEEHINVFGGEDRFWLGPEGGQYSIFFEKGKEFTMDNWFTPRSLDIDPFELTESNKSEAFFVKNIKLKNYADFEFEVEVKRTISIFSKATIKQNLGIDIEEQVQFVGFQSENMIKNIGSSSWTRSNGLLSIWILGMYIPSESTNVIIPYKDSLSLNTSYFGEIGSDRLTITNNSVIFKGDGKYRCKIGLPPKNVIPFFGSFDALDNVLTIIEYSFDGDTSYVNSLWKHQDNPYSGDVINSYNDGPLENGDQLGPFYELESSSSAKELKPTEAISHIHKTYHFEGKFEELNSISKKVLGINLSDINS